MLILKHLIYEKAIELIFSGIQNNFNRQKRDLSIGDEIKWIKVKYNLNPLFQNKYSDYCFKNMVVFHCDGNNISIKSINAPDNSPYSRIERIKRNCIIDFQLK